jgi:hypothetical protein
VKIWITAVLFGKLALGASPNCPIAISDVKRDTGLGDRITYCFSLKATNISGKSVASLELQAAAVDSKRMSHVLNYRYPLDNLAPGQTKDGYFSTHRLLGSDYRGVKVWVDRIRYADNSIWSDDGSRVCGGRDISGR